LLVARSLIATPAHRRDIGSLGSVVAVAGELDAVAQRAADGSAL